MNKQPRYGRRHYEDIASALASARPDRPTRDYLGWFNVRERLIRLFEQDNPRFDSVRFQRATEVGEA